MQKGYKLEPGTVRIVSGIVENHAQDPKYSKAIAAAEAEVSRDFDGGVGAQKELHRLLKALRLNVANRKRYPAEALIARYGLPVSLRSFQRIKARYIYRIARELGLC